MQHVHFFQYNIPADNQFTGRTDRYINVMAEWDSNHVYEDGRPMVFCFPINFTFSDCMQVKDWCLARFDIDKLAEQHFTELARIEKINQARAILAVEENPITERLIVNHFTPVS